MALITGGGGGGAGAGAKLYDFTVTGAAKSSIDTNVDGTIVANFNGYDTMVVRMFLRTDEAVVSSTIDLTINADAAGNYDSHYIQGTNVTPSSGPAVGQLFWQFFGNGASRLASDFSTCELTIPNYLGTVGLKTGSSIQCLPDSTGANESTWIRTFGWRGTAAISRIKIAPDTGGAKFAIGSRLLVYGQ